MHVVVVSKGVSLQAAQADILRQAFGEVQLSAVHTLEAAVAEVRSAKHVDLVILDLDLGGVDGIEALTQLQHGLPLCRVLVVSKDKDRGTILGVLRAGAMGYLPKTSDQKVMVAALHLVAAGGKYLPPELLLKDPMVAVRIPVTTRQRDVLRLLLKGYSNRRIASELSISQSTVKQHAQAVFDALGVSTRAQLIAAVARGGIAEGLI